jgi:putative peptidoglycan lipid II flippase
LSSLFSAVARVGGSTLVSRILGFARDLVVARVFGADAGTDAFFVAFKAPNLMRRLFGEGAFALALVPVLAEYRRGGDAKALRRLIDDLAGTLAAALLVVTALGLVAAPGLVLLLAPGYVDDAGQRALTADLLRLTLPYIWFIGLTALAGGILNTHYRFAVPAFTPALLNLVLIACALWLAPHLDAPITALALGVLIAGGVQLGFQLPFLARLGRLPRPRLGFGHPGVRRIGRAMLPTLFGVSVAQLSLLIDTFLASFLTTGSISWLYYAERLMELPLGVLGVAFGTVMLPRLSGAQVGESMADFSATLDWALRWVLLLGLPASVGLISLAGPTLATLFLSDRFGAQDVAMAAEALAAYALGLVAFIAIKVLAPGYFGRQEHRRPVRIAALALLVNLVLSLTLMYPLAHTGLALGTALAAVVNAGLLLFGLRRADVYRPGPGWPRLWLQVGVATLLMWGGISVCNGPSVDWLDMSGGERVLRLVGLIGGSLMGYLLVLAALGVRPRSLVAPVSSAHVSP